MMKQTRKDSLLWLLTPLCIGILSGIVRRWQLSSAFEGAFRLPIPAAPATIALIALWVLAAAVFILLGLKTPVAPVVREHSELALSARQDHLVLGGILCSAFLSLIAAPALLLDGSERTDEIIKSAMMWDVMGGVARRNWARNENALSTSVEYNKNYAGKGHITIPFLADDELVNGLVDKFVK